MSGNIPKSGELSPTSKVQDFSRGKLRYREKSVIMFTALALANGEPDKVKLKLGMNEEVEILCLAESFVGKQFFASCFPEGKPPGGFHGPVLGALAVRGNGLELLLRDVEQDEYILPLHGAAAMNAARTMFGGLLEFLS